MGSIALKNSAFMILKHKRLMKRPVNFSIYEENIVLQLLLLVQQRKNASAWPLH